MKPKKPKIPTYKQLEEACKAQANTISAQRTAYTSLKNDYENAKQNWQAQRANRELDLRATIVRSSAEMIESLARMVGGPGF